MSFEDPYSINYDPDRQNDLMDKLMGQGKYRDDNANFDVFIESSEKLIKKMKEKEQPTQLSEYDKDHIPEILHGQGDWFMAKLCRLIASADKQSKRQIYAGFPDAVNAVHFHQTAKTFDEEIA